MRKPWDSKTKDEWGGEGSTLKSGDTVDQCLQLRIRRHQQGDRADLRRRRYREPRCSELKDKGVFFEKYDLPGLEQRGDLYVGEGMKTAWFKDPDGNILSLIEGEG